MYGSPIFSGRITVAVIVLVVASLASSTEALCPQPTSIGRTEVPQEAIQSSRAAARLPYIPISFANSTRYVNVTANTVLVSAAPMSRTSGISGRPDPQSFFYRFSDRLQLASGSLEIVSPDLDNFSIAVRIIFDKVTEYEIFADENLDVFVTPAFFGGCSATPILVGTIVVKSSFSATAAQTASGAVSIIAMGVAGVLGIGLPAKAFGMQGMIALCLSGCASQQAVAVGGAYRGLGPFAFEASLRGMLAGNVIVILGVGLIHFVVSRIVSSPAAAYFPKASLAFATALYSGTVYCAARLVGANLPLAEGSDGILLVVGGAVSLVVFGLLFLYLIFLYITHAVRGTFHPFQLDSSNLLFTKLFAPSGMWLPFELSATVGPLVTDLQKADRVAALFSMIPPLMLALTLAADPGTAIGCTTQYAVFSILNLLFAVAVLVTAIYRSKVETLLGSFAHILLSLAGAMFAKSARDQSSIMYLEATQGILVAVTLARVINDMIVKIMDSGDIDLPDAVLEWHFGTDPLELGELPNAVNKELSSPSQPSVEADPLPMISPLATMPSMTGKRSASKGSKSNVKKPAKESSSESDDEMVSSLSSASDSPPHKSTVSPTSASVPVASAPIIAQQEVDAPSPLAVSYERRNRELANQSQVLRIDYSDAEECLVLRPQNKSEFGTMYETDSYVVQTSHDEHIEFFVWIGKRSSKEEAQAAVEEAAKLDSVTASQNGVAPTEGGHVITRVVQGSESPSFLRLFPRCSLKIQESSSSSHSAVKAAPKMFYIRPLTGTKAHDILLVPCHVDSLDDDDVFVIDCDTEVFLFAGTSAVATDLDLARSLANDLKQSRMDCEVVTVSQRNAPDRFWRAVGTSKSDGEKRNLQRLESFLPSEINRAWHVRGVNDFKLLDSGSGIGVLTLDSGKVIIFDFCSVVFVWIGKHVGDYLSSRGSAMLRGAEYLRKYSSNTTPLIRVLEGHEGALFNSLLG